MPACVTVDDAGSSRVCSSVSSPSSTMAMTESLYSSAFCGSMPTSYVSLPEGEDIMPACLRHTLQQSTLVDASMQQACVWRFFMHQADLAHTSTRYCISWGVKS